MTVDFVSVSGSLDIIKTTCLANRIFGQHFTPMMPRPQIDYILDTFNSFNVINERITTGGYSYYNIVSDNRQAGFFAYVPRIGDAFEITEIGIIKKQRGKGFCKKTSGLSFLLCFSKHDSKDGKLNRKVIRTGKRGLGSSPTSIFPQTAGGGKYRTQRPWLPVPCLPICCSLTLFAVVTIIKMAIYKVSYEGKEYGISFNFGDIKEMGRFKTPYTDSLC